MQCVKWVAMLLALVPPVAIGSEHFDIQRVADGVYAAIRKDPPGLMVNGNSVFIINDADVVVVDAHGTPSSAREALAELKKLTSKPVRYVINTHWHDDHIMGNQVYRDAFPGVAFIGHAAMREYLPVTGLGNRKKMWEGAPKFADEMRKQLAREDGQAFDGKPLTAESRESYRSDLDLIDRYLAEAPKVDVVLPTLTLESRLTLYCGDRVIDIRHLGRGHTAGDVIVHLPKEGVLVTGDLVVWPVPLVGGDQSYVPEWSATLEKLIALKATVIVPGHGPVMRDDSYLRTLAELFASITRQTRDAAARGLGVADIRMQLNVADLRKRIAGDSQVRNVLFSVYVVGPSVESVFREVVNP